MSKTAAVFFALMATTSYSFAVETKSWVQNDQSDFDKGTLTKLSLRSDSIGDPLELLGDFNAPLATQSKPQEANRPPR